MKLDDQVFRFSLYAFTGWHTKFTFVVGVGQEGMCNFLFNEKCWYIYLIPGSSQLTDQSILN